MTRFPSRVIPVRISSDEPAYYVLLCARRYSECRRKLAVSVSDEKREYQLASLRYLLQSGLIEFNSEFGRRTRCFPQDFRQTLIVKDGSSIERPITSQETELVRYAFAIPPVATVANLSASQMHWLANQVEGWAQSDLLDPVNVARLLGWSDGLRLLVEAIGADYTPPTKDAGPEKSLLQFLSEE